MRRFWSTRSLLQRRLTWATMPELKPRGKIISGRLAERLMAPVLEHAQPAPVKANLLAGYAGAKTVVPALKRGELAERSNAAVLKTVVGQPTGGSNPSLSANSLLVLPGFVGLQIAVSQAQHGSLQLVLTRSAQHVADDVVGFRLAVALNIAQH